MQTGLALCSLDWKFEQMSAAGMPTRPRHETWHLSVNATLHGAVGIHVDGFVDVETDRNIGSAPALNNTTHCKADKVHLTRGAGTTGQAALQALARPVINGLP
jgi:hypothetical protein